MSELLAAGTCRAGSHRAEHDIRLPEDRTINNFRVSARVACLKPSRLGMFAADMPSLEGLRHATQIRKLFVGCLSFLRNIL
jgi:hypothetical protein